MRRLQLQKRGSIVPMMRQASASLRMIGAHLLAVPLGRPAPSVWYRHLARMLLLLVVAPVVMRLMWRLVTRACSHRSRWASWLHLMGVALCRGSLPSLLGSELVAGGVLGQVLRLGGQRVSPKILCERVAIFCGNHMFRSSRMQRKQDMPVIPSLVETRWEGVPWSSAATAEILLFGSMQSSLDRRSCACASSLRYIRPHHERRQMEASVSPVGVTHCPNLLWKLLWKLRC